MGLSREVPDGAACAHEVTACRLRQTTTFVTNERPQWNKGAGAGHTCAMIRAAAIERAVSCADVLFAPAGRVHVVVKGPCIVGRHGTTG